MLMVFSLSTVDWNYGANRRRGPVSERCGSNRRQSRVPWSSPQFRYQSGTAELYSWICLSNASATTIGASSVVSFANARDSSSAPATGPKPGVNDAGPTVGNSNREAVAADSSNTQAPLPLSSHALEPTTGQSVSQTDLTSLNAGRTASAPTSSLQTAAPAATDMRIALVHDWFPAYRGGERVVSSMLDLLPEADVFTLFDFLTKEERDAYFGGRRFTVSAMNSWPFVRRSYRHLFFLCPFFIEQFNVVEYDGVYPVGRIRTGCNHAARPAASVLCAQPDPLCLGSAVRVSRPSRSAAWAQGFLFRWMLHRMRIWDVRTAFGPDLMVANSTYVRERIRRIYGRDAQVIFPPVEVDNMPFCERKDDYYVVASFLVPYKRIDLIVRAFNAMPNRRLRVVGEGQQARELQAIAGPNIAFTGYLSRAAFLDTIAQAKAFVFAGCEDFGIVMAEAQACGTPLIAFGRGGARDIVRSADSSAAPTGLLFGRQTTEAIIAAVEAFEAGNGETVPEACRENAMRFSEARFHREFADVWGKAVEANRRGFVIGDGISTEQKLHNH